MPSTRDDSSSHRCGAGPRRLVTCVVGAPALVGSLIGQGSVAAATAPVAGGEASVEVLGVVHAEGGSLVRRDGDQYRLVLDATIIEDLTEVEGGRLSFLADRADARVPRRFGALSMFLDYVSANVGATADNPWLQGGSST